MLDDASTLMSKSQPAQIVDGFSPQNLAAKLLNSLNNKSEKQENTNEMLIFDNDQPKPIENLEPKTLEKLEPEEEQKDSGIESGVETLSIVPFVEIHSKKQNEFNQKENIVDLLLSQLVNEIKENMFPARPTLDSFLDANDPTSCYAPMGKSPFSWFSIQSDLISKLAFENDKGISTGFNSCDFYLKDVIDEIMKNESTFINNILTPIQRDPMEMMRLLQTSDIGNYSHFDTYDPIIPILGVEIYLEIERRKEMDRQENGESSDRSNSESLITE